MSSLTLVLLFLISVQAAFNMGKDAQTLPTPQQSHPQPHPHPQPQQEQEQQQHRQQHHEQQHHHHQHHQMAQKSKSQTSSRKHTHSHSRAGGRHHPKPDSQIPTVDPRLFNKRRYHSPRVLFSDVVPATGIEPVMVARGRGQKQGSDKGWDRGPRIRRRADQLMHRGEYSVCDSVSHWVTNKTLATDISGKEVTVLSVVRSGDTVKKQLFYETTCRLPTKPSSGNGGGGPGGGSRGGTGGNNSRGGGKSSQGSSSSSSGCRGIDSRHWNSYCTNTHTYVRALTIYNNQEAWRLIRINAACVCVVSRKSWRRG